jgi:hypothetical protein
MSQNSGLAAFADAAEPSGSVARLSCCPTKSASQVVRDAKRVCLFSAEQARDVLVTDTARHDERARDAERKNDGSEKRERVRDHWVIGNRDLVGDGPPDQRAGDEPEWDSDGQYRQGEHDASPYEDASDAPRGHAECAQYREFARS